MIAVIDKGRVVRVTEDLDGLDLTGLTTLEVPHGYDPVRPSHILVDGEWQDNLDSDRNILILKVNQLAAEKAVSGGAQPQVYAIKEAEAVAWTPEANASYFPFLAAEASATGMEIVELVQVILTKSREALARAAAIEGSRRGLIVAIRAASCRSDLAAIDIESGWPPDQLTNGKSPIYRNGPLARRRKSCPTNTCPRS